MIPGILACDRLARGEVFDRGRKRSIELLQVDPKVVTRKSCSQSELCSGQIVYIPGPEPIWPFGSAPLLHGELGGCKTLL